jgi:CheY-like chemotaxis protein
MNKAILIVEDNPAIRELIGEFLATLIDTDGVKILKTGKESEAGEILQNEDVSVLITDINLGREGDGLSLVDRLAERPLRPYVIAISSIEWLGRVDRYLKRGLVDTFLSKPFSYKDLRNKLLDSRAVKLKEKVSSFN